VAERDAAAAAERRRAEEEQRREDERRRQEEEARRRAEQEATEREQTEAAAVAERQGTAAAERRRVEAAEKEQGRDANGGGEVGHAALLGPAVVSEISGSGTGALGAAGDRTDAAAFTGAGARVVQAKPGAAEPAWRHPGVWAWQLLAVVSLLVNGALLGAYFFTRPDHEAGLSANVPHVTKQTSKSLSGGTSGQARAQARQTDRGAVVRRPLSETASSQRQSGSNTVGLPMAVALRELEAAGFSVHLKYVYSQVPAGQVVAQNPPGKTPMKSGRKVALVISVGPQPRARSAGTSSQ